MPRKQEEPTPRKARTTTTDPREPGRKVPQYISGAEEDDIEQAGEDSFPASDPPSFTPVTHPGKPRRKKG